MTEYKDDRWIPWPNRPFAMSFHEIGLVEGISGEKARQICRDAIAKLKKTNALCDSAQTVQN